MSDSVLSVTFWTLFNSLLRSTKGGEGELERARKACAWLTGELAVLVRFCSPEEADLIGLIYQHWSSHHEAPSYTILRHNLQQASNPVLEEHLKEFEAQRKDLPRLPPEDLPAHLGTKMDEFSRDRLAQVLKAAMMVNSTGVDVKVKGGKPGETRKLKGPKDAMRYVVEQFDKGIGGKPSHQTHGTLQECTHLVESIYQENADPNRQKGKRILTGIQCIDKTVKIRKGHFVGLLGYAGHGKTRLGRTMLYNAALAGNNCLHFSLEQSFEEELVRYAIIHSHHPMWGKGRGINLAAYEDGALSREQHNFLMKEVLVDLADATTLPGRITLRQPTEGASWESVKTQIYTNDRTTPLDVVMIDYLTMCRPTNHRHAREEMEDNIQDAKTEAMTFRENEGLLMITPVQSNRDGWIEAGKNGGRYEMDAVWMYSMFDKALDLCLSVYSDDDLDKEAKVIVGSAKHRRGPNIPPTRIGVNHDCGTFHDLSNGSGLKEEDIDKAMEDL